MVTFAGMAAAALPALVGGLFGKKENSNNAKLAKKMAKKDFERLQKIRAEDRDWYEDDRSDERSYAAQQLAKDRAYAEGQILKDRQYAEKMLGKTTAEARVYAEQQRKLAEGRFKTDRKDMQSLADRQAERAAASRGIDFKQLRDDAISAGYNPLTAMSMAHAYSTDIAYGTVGDVYGGGGELTAGVGGYSPGGSSGMMPMSGGVAPGGGFQTSGMGYTGTQLPPLMSSAGFIAEAVARGVDNWFNSPPPQDQEAQAVMRDVQSRIIRAEAAASTPRDFGYDLTKIEPFRPMVSYGTGALSDKVSPSDRETSPSQLPLHTPFGDLHPSGDYTDAETVETRYGDIPSGAYGLAMLGRDLFGAVDRRRPQWKDGRAPSTAGVPFGDGSFARTGTSFKGPDFSNPFLWGF